MIRLSAARRGALVAIVLFGLSAVALAGISQLGDAERLDAALARVDASLIAGLIVLALFNYFLRAVRFQIYARRLGIIVPFASTLVCYVAGFAMSATPGKVGELWRLWLLRRRHGVAIARSLPLQIADRTSDVIATVLLCVAALGSFTQYRGAVVGVATVLALGVGALMQPRLLLAAIRAGYGLCRWNRRLFARARRMVRMTARLFVPSVFLPTLLLAVIGWGAECVAFDLCLHAVTGSGGIGRATFIFTAANLAGGLTLLPGGIGSADLSIVALLVSSGTPWEEAALATLLIRVATLWFGILTGFIATFFALRSPVAAGDSIARRPLAAAAGAPR